MIARKTQRFCIASFAQYPATGQAIAALAAGVAGVERHAVAFLDPRGAVDLADDSRRLVPAVVTRCVERVGAMVGMAFGSAQGGRHDLHDHPFILGFGFRDVDYAHLPIA